LNLFFNKHISQVHVYGLAHTCTRNICWISLCNLSLLARISQPIAISASAGKQVLFCTCGTIYESARTKVSDASRSTRLLYTLYEQVDALLRIRRNSVSSASCTTSSVSGCLQLPLTAVWSRCNKWRKCLDKGDENFFLPISTGRKTTPSASPYYYYY
jgi:hypothetical protein